MRPGTHSFFMGPFPISPEAPPIFLAEIGGFFGQDIDLAREMIGQIILAGRLVPEQPMILKTEILHDPEICLQGNLMETYAAKDGRVQHENYRALIERKVVPLAQYAELFALCRSTDTPFIVSVYDFAGADFGRQEGASALKIASSNITHIPLIRHCASKGIPLVIDTGRSTIAEVHRALDVARLAGCVDLVVEHSPDGHPSLPQAHNLRILQTYSRAFDLPVGLSDHHVGLEMLYVAVALGASLIEKGVHIAPDALDIDISHTMDIKDLPAVLRAVHQCWQALGRGARDMGEPIRGVLGTSQRQCLIASRDLQPGDKINLGSVRFAFPKQGIGVEHWDLVEGWSLVSHVLAGRPVRWQDVEPRAL